MVIDAQGNIYEGPNSDVEWGIVNGKPGVVGWTKLTQVK